MKLNKQSVLSLAVDESIDMTVRMFHLITAKKGQEEVDRIDDIRREKSRESIRKYIKSIRETGEGNEKIIKLADALENDFERNCIEEDKWELIDDVARTAGIIKMDKMIEDSKQLNKILEEIHLKQQKNKKSCDGNRNS